MTNPNVQEHPIQEDELELEPEEVKDLDVDENDAGQVVGGSQPYSHVGH